MGVAKDLHNIFYVMFDVTLFRGEDGVNGSPG